MSPRHRRTFFDEAEELASFPEYNSLTKWAVGCGLSAVVAGYSAFCLVSGETFLFGQQGKPFMLRGEAAFYLALSYLLIGLFIHFHWFWGQHDKLWPVSQWLKAICVAAFLFTFARTLILLFQ